MHLLPDCPGVVLPLSRRVALAAATILLQLAVHIPPSLALAVSQPAVTLQNAAQAAVHMPVMGLGTGGYGRYYHNGSEVTQATKAWLAMGGERIDTSFSYGDQVPIAAGIAASGLARDQVFITSKVGPFEPLGYNDTLVQFRQVLKTLNTSYVDLLLIHWPGQTSAPKNVSTDPACAGPASSPKACRQSTWKALELIFTQHGARAIGVSNFEVRHLQEIEALGGQMPSVNQCEFHPFWHPDDLVTYCRARNITFNGYSPLGAPDVSSGRGWDLRVHPTIVRMAQRLGRSAAQVILRYELQQGMVLNPRTKNVTHMRENLGVFGWNITASDAAAIAELEVPPGKQPNICPDPALIP